MRYFLDETGKRVYTFKVRDNKFQIKQYRKEIKNRNHLQNILNFVFSVLFIFKLNLFLNFSITTKKENSLYLLILLDSLLMINFPMKELQLKRDTTSYLLNKNL
jgi:hypothetical protein